MSITESVLLRSEKSVFWFATNGTKKWGWGGLLPPVMAHLGLLTRILRRKKMKVGEEGEMQAVRRKIKKAETP
jgi:hypothetical protein